MDKMQEYWASLSADEKDDFCANCEKSYDHMRGIFNNHRSASPALAKIIEIHSGGKIGREIVRPDVFGR